MRDGSAAAQRLLLCAPCPRPQLCCAAWLWAVSLLETRADSAHCLWHPAWSESSRTRLRISTLVLLWPDLRLAPHSPPQESTAAADVAALLRRHLNVPRGSAGRDSALHSLLPAASSSRKRNDHDGGRGSARGEVEHDAKDEPSSGGGRIEAEGDVSHEGFIQRLLVQQAEVLSSQFPKLDCGGLTSVGSDLQRGARRALSG